jgi:DASS family divalent anion:Na+ symporter
MRWIINAWPLGIALFVICCGAVILFYRPKDAKPVSKEFSQKQYEALGPITKEEKISAAVLILCVIMWVLEKTIGVSAAVTAQLGMVLLLGLKIIDRNDFRTKIPWESIVFIAASTSLASVFSSTGISTWVGETFSGALSPLFVNPVVMVVATAIIIYLFRYFFVSQTGLMTIFVVACAPFAEAAGINPWCFGFVVLNIVNCFPMKYSNATVLTALAASGNMCEFKQVSKMSLVYLLACIVGILCCIPVWKVTGLC